MQIITHINNAKCLEWGLNANQGALFDMLYNAALAHGNRLESRFSRRVIINELPLYFRQEDTVYRAYKKLAKQGLITHDCFDGLDFYQITKKGKEWAK